MTKNNNFSETIQTLMMNEINAVIRKYSNIETKKLEYVEILLSKVDDNKLKQELLQDFDNVIKLSTEIENNNVDSNIIRAYLWIKNNMQLDITLNSVAEEFKEVATRGYAMLNKDTVIYKNDEGLEEFLKEKLKYMLEDVSYVDKLFSKDKLIDIFLNGTTKDEMIEELISENDIDELINIKTELMFDNDSDEYMYVKINC